MDYLTWNDRLAERFLNPSNGHRRVYLFVTKDLIADVGSDCKLPIADFISAVKLGPPWSSPGNVCKKAEDAFADWRQRNRRYPTYFAYLALFSLAAGIESDSAVNAYYPRLRRLLGEGARPGAYPHFSKLRPLWADLDVWTQVDKRGSLGVFRSDTHTRLVHVGMPISQTIFSETERSLLPRIFADAGLDPDATPSDTVLEQTLIHNRHHLRPRTRAILAGLPNRGDDLVALLEATADALAEWDGTDSELQTPTSHGSVSGRAVLWCEDLDSVAENMTLRVLLRTNHEFPEGLLQLQLPGVPGLFACEELRLGWSTELTSANGNPLDASRLDWTDGVRFEGVNTNWVFRLQSAPVRLFISAEAEHLSGFIEALSLQPNTPFLLFADRAHTHLVEQWGRSSCTAFRSLRVRSGLPSGWFAYASEGAHSDEPVRNHVSALSFPTTSRITPKAGIVGSRNSYFSFALPDILVTGVPNDAELFCNGQRAGRCDGPPLPIPDSVSTAARLSFEVRVGSTVVCRKSIGVEPPIPWPLVPPLTWSDSFGEPGASDSPKRVWGAVVCAPAVPNFSAWFNPEPKPTGPVAVATPMPQPTAGAVAKTLLAQWHKEIAERPRDLPPESIARRSLGEALTEGCLQYVTACGPGGTTRNFARAIFELRRATQSSDLLVSTAARALLQLALYRSGRQPEAVDDEVTSPQFGRLQHFMALLAGQSFDVPSMDGIGIADISPLSEDATLEHQLISRTPSTP